jgi:hypothetical protein
MLMLETYKVTVNINNILTIQRHTIPCLILISNTFRKKPVQNGKVNMHGLELPTVKLQVSNAQAVFKLVELDEPAITQQTRKCFLLRLQRLGTRRDEPK